MVSKIKAMNLERTAIELLKRGLGTTDAARILTQKCGKLVNAMNVNDFIKSDEKIKREVDYGKKKVMENKSVISKQTEKLSSMLEKLITDINELGLEKLTPKEINKRISGLAKLSDSRNKSLELDMKLKKIGGVVVGDIERNESEEHYKILKTAIFEALTETKSRDIARMIEDKVLKAIEKRKN